MLPLWFPHVEGDFICPNWANFTWRINHRPEIARWVQSLLGSSTKGGQPQIPQFPGTSRVILGLNSQLRDRWDGAGRWFLSVCLRWWSLDMAMIWLFIPQVSLCVRMANGTRQRLGIYHLNQSEATSYRKAETGSPFYSLKGAGSEVRRQWPVD
jgi:hypothetical protein